MEKKKMVFQVPAQLSSINALARGTLKLTFNSQEGIDSEAMKRLFELYEKTGWLSFNVEKIEAENLANLPVIKVADYEGKTPSQTQRALLWRLWEKHGKVGVFEDYYIKSMGRFNKGIRDELEKLD